MITTIISVLIYLCILVLMGYLAQWILEVIGVRLPIKVVQIFWVIIMLVILLVIIQKILPHGGIYLTSSAEAHNSKSGWEYPGECCGKQDCAEIDNMIILPDGSRQVTTKVGTVIFPKDFQIRLSGDEKPHACMSLYVHEDGKRTPYCLFLVEGY